jgi:4-amino-4-deoxy-L-arabinose transferase-like glycosyltransferase
MLLATILASQYVLARAYLPMGRAQSISLNAGQVFLFWFALGAGILIKGPIGPMVVGLTCAGLCVLRRDFAILRSLRPFRGLVLVLAMILPWLIAISVKSDGAFWAKSLGEDMLAKVGTGQESHGAPPGTYIALLWFTFWPGSVILAGLLPRLWVRRRNPVVSFALAWILPTWVIFELTATKLIHYVLPVYPALALLIAFGVVHARLSRWSVGISGVLAVIPAILLAAFYFQAQTLGADVGIYFWLGAGGVLGASVLVVVALHKGTQSVLALALAWGGLSLSTALYPSVARMDVLWPAKQVAALAQTVPNCSLSIVGYQEPSLIFLTQRRAKFDTPQMSQARFAAPGCVIAVVEEAELAAFSALVSQAKPTQVIKGFNIGQGRMITLHVFENN